MLLKLAALREGERLEPDVCIVGAGPAGISLALELLGRGLSLVLLESGGESFDSAAQELNAGEGEGGFPPMGLGVSRLRMLGGTSNHWTGQCGPLDRIDFEPRAWMPLSGWPFRREALDPYYVRAHERMQLGPFEYAPSEEEDDDTRLLELGGGGLEHRLRRRKALRFAAVYRAALERAADLRVVTDATLTRIRLDEGGQRVRELEVRSLSGPSIRVAARATVLACGGIENARVLLASGLGERLDFVGRCFMWHARLVSGVVALSRPLGGTRNPYSCHEPEDWQTSFALRLGDAEERQARLPNYGFFLERGTTRAERAWRRLGQRARLERELEGSLDDVTAVIADLDGLFEDEDKAGPRVLAIRTYLDQVPNPDSRIRLGATRDALGVPRARAQWRFLDSERAWVREANVRLGRRLGAAGVGRVRLSPALEARESFEQGIRDGWGGGHQMGTTRMSAAASEGVVDAHGRVHGVSNLYCAGSSVFPTGGWMNPTLTIVALALRLADHLRAQLRERGSA